MVGRMKVRYEMIERVCGFGEAHVVELPAGSAGAEALTALQAARREIDEHYQSAFRADPRINTRVAKVRDLLRDEMRVMVRTLRGVSTPAPASLPLRMPQRVSDPELLDAARLLAREVDAHRDELLRLHLPAATISKFHETVELFEHARERERARRAQSTAGYAGVRRTMEAAMVAIHTLDIVFSNMFAEHPEQRAGWRVSRREARPRRSRKRRRAGVETVAGGSALGPAPE